MKRLLLVDGTNFFFRGSWGTGGYPNKNGHDMTYLYAFVRNFCTLVRQYEVPGDEVKTVVCWDGGYDRRTAASRKAVAAGIVPKEYKQTRKEAKAQQTPEQRRDGEDFKWCLQKGRELLRHTRFSQCLIPGEEADDVVGSWCRQTLGDYDETIVVTSDRDYYQLLFEGVKIYNPIRKTYATLESLKEEYGLEDPHQWVEAGALSGDEGDTIYGIPGIGTTTAARLIAQHGSIQGIYQWAQERWKDKIAEMGLEGFCRGVRDGSYRPTPMKEAKVLAYRRVVELAYELKGMHLDLPLSEEAGTPDWRGIEKIEMEEGISIPQSCRDTLLRGGL